MLMWWAKPRKGLAKVTMDFTITCEFCDAEYNIDGEITTIESGAIWMQTHDCDDELNEAPEK